MAFHWRDGITFERKDDGRVDMFVPLVANGEAGTTHHIPAAEWASIIAAVSAIGETAEQYADALSFHGELLGRREPAGG